MQPGLLADVLGDGVDGARHIGRGGPAVQGVVVRGPEMTQHAVHIGFLLAHRRVPSTFQAH